MRALGFGRAVLVARNAAMERRAWWRMDSRTRSSGGCRRRSGGRVWRRWLRLLERRREEIGSAAGLWLDLRDPWGREEFGAAFGGAPPVAIACSPSRARAEAARRRC